MFFPHVCGPCVCFASACKLHRCLSFACFDYFCSCLVFLAFPLSRLLLSICSFIFAFSYSCLFYVLPPALSHLFFHYMFLSFLMVFLSDSLSLCVFLRLLYFSFLWFSCRFGSFPRFPSPNLVHSFNLYFLTFFQSFLPSSPLSLISSFLQIVFLLFQGILTF